MWWDVRIELLLRVWVLSFSVEKRRDGRPVRELTIILKFSNLDVQLFDLTVEKNTGFVAQGDLLILKLLTEVVVFQDSFGIFFLFGMRHQTAIQLDVFLQIPVLGVDGVLVLLHLSVFGLDFFHHVVDLRWQVRSIMNELLQH